MRDDCFLLKTVSSCRFNKELVVFLQRKWINSWGGIRAHAPSQIVESYSSYRNQKYLVVLHLLFFHRHIFWGWYLTRGYHRYSVVGTTLDWVENLKCRNPIGKCILLMSPCVGLLPRNYLSLLFYCLVNGYLYLLTTWLPVHGLFFMVGCVWLCCLTYVIVWISRVEASFKCWSILITNLGKQSYLSPSVCFFFFLMCLCCCIGDFSFRYTYIYVFIIYIRIITWHY